MTSFFNLVKVFLIQRYRPTSEKDKKRTLTIWIVLAVCLIPMAAIFVVSFFNLGALALQTGIVRECLTYIILLCQVIVVFFGVTSVINIIYLSKDNILLLALPLSPQKTFAAKLTYVYINETIANLAMMLIMIVPFGIGAGVSWWYYLQVIITALLTPMLPLLLAVIISIPLMYFVSFLKNKGFGATIVYCVLFSALMIGYYLLIYSMPSDDSNIEDVMIAAISRLAAATQYMYPEYLLALGLTATTFGEYCLGTFGSMGISLALLAIAILIASAVYRTSISRQLEIPVGSKTDTATKKFAHRGKIFALLGNDVKGILRDSSAGVNCCLTVIMPPVMAVVLTIVSGSMTETMPAEYSVLFPFFFCLIFCWMLSAVNMTATSAFSREGSRFALYKTMPIDGELICKEKVLISVIFVGIASLLTSIVLIFTIGLTIAEAFLVFFAMVIWSSGANILQVLIDLSNPRLHWNTFIEGCKNNPAQGWGMLIGTLQIIVMFAAGGILQIFYFMTGLPYLNVLSWVLLFVLGVAYVIVAYLILMKKSNKIFARTEG